MANNTLTARRVVVEMPEDLYTRLQVARETKAQRTGLRYTMADFLREMLSKHLAGEA